MLTLLKVTFSCNTKAGFSNYNAVNMTVKVSRPRPVQCIPQPYTASYNENPEPT
jgi:hypothetical protein